MIKFLAFLGVHEKAKPTPYAEVMAVRGLISAPKSVVRFN
jgi:hypothetical protein